MSGTKYTEQYISCNCRRQYKRHCKNTIPYAGSYAVIYITEAAAAGIETAIDRYREQPLPSVILIPGISGNTGKGVESVKHSVEQAVGSDILFGDA